MTDTRSGKLLCSANLDLMQRFKDGEHAALATVYHEQRPGVERFLRGRLCRMGVYTPSNLADLVQDVFAQAFATTTRQRFDPQRPYTPFILAIARNVIVDWARRLHAEIHDESAIQQALEKDVVFPSTEDALAKHSASLLIRRYVKGLPEGLREVYYQRFVLNQPQRHAAKALGVSRQTLRTLECRLLAGASRALSPPRYWAPSVAA